VEKKALEALFVPQARNGLALTYPKRELYWAMQSRLLRHVKRRGSEANDEDDLKYIQRIEWYEKSLREHLLLLKATTGLVVNKKGRRVKEEVDDDDDDDDDKTDSSDFAYTENDKHDRSMNEEESVIVETKRMRADSDDATENLEHAKKKAKLEESTGDLMS
jgi:hypothetical protein